MTTTAGNLNLLGDLNIASGKSLTVSNALTLTGTDGSSVNFGTGGTVIYAGGAFVASITGTVNEITASAATGAVMLSLPAALTFTGKTVTGGTFVAPALGTPTTLVLTNATGTPSAIGLANGTGLPISTGVSGLATGIATFLATPSSSNLAASVTDETGTGPLVFATSPTLSGTIGGALIWSSAQSFSSTITPSQTAGIVGTTTNNSVNAGSVGEVVTSTVLVGSAVNLSTGNAADITSIALTAGDWDVSGNIVIFDSGTGTLFTQLFGWLNGVSATAPTLPAAAYLQQLAGIDGTFSFPTGSTRVSLAAPATIYLSCRAGFSVSTAAAYGTVMARRRR